MIKIIKRTETEKKISQSMVLKQVSFETDKRILYRETYENGELVNGIVYAFDQIPACIVRIDGTVHFNSDFLSWATTHKDVEMAWNVLKDIDELLTQVIDEYRMY